MAGKTKPMSQIKQLLLLIKQGYGNKAIARELGMSRNTVKSYRQKAAHNPVSIDHLLEQDDPVLESNLHAGNPAYSDGRFTAFKDRLDNLVGELKDSSYHQKITLGGIPLPMSGRI